MPPLTACQMPFERQSITVPFQRGSRVYRMSKFSPSEKVQMQNMGHLAIYAWKRAGSAECKESKFVHHAGRLGNGKRKMVTTWT